MPCCRRATGAAGSRLRRAASAGPGHLGRSTACADPRRPGRPLEPDPVAKVAALRTDPGGGLAAAQAHLGAILLSRRES